MNLTRLFAHKFENSKNWNLSLSKLGKLQAGMYLILEDYSQGLFPPKFEDQAKTYAGSVIALPCPG